jgi:hypothetical protein
MMQASIASSSLQAVAAPDASQESVWKARGAIVITSMNGKNKTRLCLSPLGSEILF